MTMTSLSTTLIFNYHSKNASKTQGFAFVMFRMRLCMVDLVRSHTMLWLYTNLTYYMYYISLVYSLETAQGDKVQQEESS